MKKRKHAPVDWDSQPLGKMPDHDLARLTGTTPGAVASARRTRKIRAFQGPGHKKSDGSPQPPYEFGQGPKKIDLETLTEIAVRIVRSESTATSEAEALGLKPCQLSERLNAIRKATGRSVFDEARDIVAGKKKVTRAKLRDCLKCGKRFKSAGPENRICYTCGQSDLFKSGGTQIWHEPYALYF